MKNMKMAPNIFWNSQIKLISNKSLIYFKIIKYVHVPIKQYMPMHNFINSSQ